jgi:hypothetical protein
MLLLGALGLAIPLWRTRNQTAAGGSNQRLS